MKRDDFGVWEVTLPAKNGHPAISHNTKVKVNELSHTTPTCEDANAE